VPGDKIPSKEPVENDLIPLEKGQNISRKIEPGLSNQNIIPIPKGRNHALP